MRWNRSNYVEEHEEIRRWIQGRAQDLCEWCTAPNHVFGFHNKEGDFYLAPGPGPVPSAEDSPGYVAKKIILTMAHLDQDTRNNDPENLAFLCQRCHLNHDRPHNLVKIGEARDRRHNQMRLF